MLPRRTINLDGRAVAIGKLKKMNTAGLFFPSSKGHVFLAKGQALFALATATRGEGTGEDVWVLTKRKLQEWQFPWYCGWCRRIGVSGSTGTSAGLRVTSDRPEEQPAVLVVPPAP